MRPRRSAEWHAARRASVDAARADVAHRSLAQRIVLRVERPAAYCLLIGAAVTFVGVLGGFIATGQAKWATLLIAADLLVSGASAVQEAET